MGVEKQEYPHEIDGNFAVSSVKYRISEGVFQRIKGANSLDQRKKEINGITDVLELITLCEELREEMDKRGLSYIPDNITGNPYAWFMHHVYQCFRKKPSCPRTKKIYVNGKRCYVGKAFKYKIKSFKRFACFMVEAIYEDDFKKHYIGFHTL